MADIRNALAAGKDVTVHQAPITQSGWTGSGYIITDPATGAGAYMISGGANGTALIDGVVGALFEMASFSKLAIVAFAGKIAKILLPIIDILKVVGSCSGTAQFMVGIYVFISFVVAMAVIGTLSVVGGIIATLVWGTVSSLILNALIAKQCFINMKKFFLSRFTQYA